jgi:hypothetical protein
MDSEVNSTSMGRNGYFSRDDYVRQGYLQRSQETEEIDSFRPSADLMSYRSEFKNDMLGRTLGKSKEKIKARPKWQTSSPIGLEKSFLTQTLLRKNLERAILCFKGSMTIILESKTRNRLLMLKNKEKIRANVWRCQQEAAKKKKLFLL